MTETPEVAPASEPLRGRWGPVTAWGRTYPRAGGAERLLMVAGALGCALILGIAAWLEPDLRGIGTHEKLGLPACGFAVGLKVPCPSCGFTTTFTLAAEGQVWPAIRNQPFGFVLFLGTVLAVPLLGAGAWKQISWLDATVHWPWLRISAAVFGLWMLGWAYKYWLMA